jgi:hypothetical protein
MQNIEIRIEERRMKTLEMIANENVGLSSLSATAE